METATTAGGGGKEDTSTVGRGEAARADDEGPLEDEAGAADVASNAAMNSGEACDELSSPSSPLSSSSSSSTSSSKLESSSSSDADSFLFHFLARAWLRSRFAFSRADQAARRSFRAFARAAASRLIRPGDGGFRGGDREVEGAGLQKRKSP